MAIYTPTLQSSQTLTLLPRMEADSLLSRRLDQRGLDTWCCLPRLDRIFKYCLMEINEVIFEPEHHSIWKAEKSTAAGAKNQNINGIADFSGGVLGGGDTAQLGVMLLLSLRFQSSLQSVLSRFFGYQCRFLQQCYYPRCPPPTFLRYYRSV
jgi:hypothetical protein